ncbi:hypothetical protein F2P56_024364 [Juglans regia]|uniref:Reverse transcriptase zinc-binding domain-containing protein n=2 Tax=Juglans regia TaxID=51240 RepID=A0A833WL56_JUGRE|nr:uncharacterized protein LOC108995212 [Juglans regia]KAF5454718.1 hypothetical protein F2P56_024364 [Juglans regia]
MGVKMDDRWRNIWDLEVPSVTKLLLWKAENDLLPTKKNLFKRKVVEDKSCPICKAEEETPMHVLWQYPTTNDIWAEDGSCVQKWGRTEDEFMLLWEKLMGMLSKSKLEDKAMLFRRVWLQRNEYVFLKRLMCPKVLLKIVRKALLDYQASQTNQKHERQVQDNAAKGSLKWEKPGCGFVKVN